MLIAGRLIMCAGVFSLALPACAGPTQAPLPAPIPPKTTLSNATQRSAAQAALAAEFGANIFTMVFAQGTSQDFGGPATSAVCNNGTQVGIVSSFSQVITTTIDVFYDPACTRILAHVVLAQRPTTLTFPHHFISFLDGTATLTSRAGTVVAYDTLTGDVDKGFSPFSIFFNVFGTAAANPSGPATGSFALSCYYTGSSKTCGFAGIQNISPTVEVGNAFTFNGTETANVVDTGGAVLNAYLSAPNAMSIVPPRNSTDTDWTIAGGGNPVMSDTGKIMIRAGAYSLATTIDVSLSDVPLDAGVAATMPSGPFGDATGNVMQAGTGATASSYTVDGSGTGTILFSDGTTAPVSGFIIQ